MIALEAPAVCEAQPAIFAQGHLFQEFDPKLSSLQLFEESVGEALCGGRESDLYDQPLLDVVLQFKKILGSGVEQIELRDPASSGGRVCLDGDLLHGVEELMRQTPPDQRIRLAGQLDTIRHSDRMFTLLLDDGQSIRGIAESVESDQLAALFGQRALVSGRAVFRPSGSVLRIEIDRLQAAEGDSALWSQLPRPALGKFDGRSQASSQGPRSGVNKIFGHWPGEESEEEILRALETLS